MIQKFFLISGLALVAGISSVKAYAFPMPTEGMSIETLAMIEPEAFAAIDFTAIVALSNCSGSLVRYETSLGNEPAMILTNGHCLGGGFLKPGEVRVNTDVTRAFRLLTSDGKGTLARLSADRVLYATMTNTDMTLYRLTQTYDEIEKQTGVHALTISSKHPVEGTKIAVASGYWKRIYNCAIDRFIYSLKEGNWTFTDSIRYTQPGCEIIGGTSGSPIINAETHEVIGVNNTTNESGEQCTVNNPCEVDAEGKVVVNKGKGYGQETYWVYSCLDSKNAIDLEKEGCLLPKPGASNSNEN